MCVYRVCGSPLKVVTVEAENNSSETSGMNKTVAKPNITNASVQSEELHGEVHGQPSPAPPPLCRGAATEASDALDIEEAAARQERIRITKAEAKAAEEKTKRTA